jgi:hypothetical protein
VKKLLFSLLLLGLALFAPTEIAHATNCGTGTGTCYVLGAGGNWNTSGTWSDTDGGGSCACTPATGDDILLTVNSGNSTINANITVGSLDTTGFVGTLTHNSAITLTVNGNDAGAPNGTTFYLNVDMAYTLGSATTSAVTFSATSGTTTIIAEKTLGNLTFDGSGGTFVLGADLAIGTNSTLTSTNGNVNFNGFDVDAGAFVASATNVRTFTCGSGTLTSIGTTVGAVWNMANSANLTLVCNTGTVRINGAGTLVRTISPGASNTYNNFEITPSALGNREPIYIAQSSVTTTIANLTLANITYLAYNGSSHVLHVTGAFTWTGPGTSAPGFFGASGATATGLQLRVNTPTTLSGLIVYDITEHASSSAITFTSSYDAGKNSGVDITLPTSSPAHGMVMP